MRSFSRRQGRITPGQREALAKHWHCYCLDSERVPDLAVTFGRSAPTILEIGFGNGESLATMAAAHPELNYIGVEVHRPGVGHLMLQLERQGLNNVRIFCHDAIEILKERMTDNSLAGVHLFFPDPWPKTRHHKRRIVQPEFSALIRQKLETGGYFHAATDWQHYAQQMLKVLSSTQGLINSSPNGGFCSRPDYRPLTKFENRGLRLGHGVWDLIFKKIEV